MALFSYVLKKISYLAVSLFFVVTVTFLLMKALPGDPFTQEQGLPPEIVQGLRRTYGLDAPLTTQYTQFVKAVVTWNLGPSMVYHDRLVTDIITQGFPVSAILGLEALGFAVVVGIPLGVLAALYHTSWIDRTTQILAALAISIPNFVVATLLQYTLALEWHLFPVARWGTPAHSVLPALALGALPMAFLLRLTRSNMIEIMEQDFIKTARMKGLSEWAVVVRHGLRNASLPLLTYLGQLAASILVGSFVIERIFGVPGLGQCLVTSVSNRDYTVIMGVTVFCSVILLSIIFLIDLLYGVIDPRIRTARSGV